MARAGCATGATGFTRFATEFACALSALAAALAAVLAAVLAAAVAVAVAEDDEGAEDFVSLSYDRGRRREAVT